MGNKSNEEQAEASRQLVHELRVHQIELELQNEELRRTQAELATARARYFDLYDLAPVGYCTVSATEDILEANLTAASMLGLTCSELVGKAVQHFILPQDQDIYYLHRKLLVDTGQPQSCILRMLRAHGQPFWAQLSATFDAAAAGHAVHRLVLTDVDARKVAQDQARISDVALKAVSQGVLITGPDLHIVSANQAFTTMFGYSQVELQGFHSAGFNGPLTDATALAAFVQAIAARQEFSGEFLNYRKDGSCFWNEVFVSPVLDAEGQLTHFISINTDITERKRLTQVLHDKNLELQLATTLAEKASLAKSDFLSSMSHELRTPLNSILGFAQLLEAGTPAPTAAQLQRIEMIQRGGWYLLTLVNEILGLASIEAGKVALTLEPVAVAGILADCRCMIEPDVQRSGIRVDFAAVPESTRVIADPVRLKQVIFNLLTNAIKYNRAQGTVEVQVSATTARTLRISVQDTGLGLSADALAQLFLPFSRLGQERGAIEGTGIGLVVTRRLTELMGGSVGVHSVEGEGSVFWVELQAARAPMQANARAMTLTPRSWPSRPILPRRTRGRWSRSAHRSFFSNSVVAVFRVLAIDGKRSSRLPADTPGRLDQPLEQPGPERPIRRAFRVPLHTNTKALPRTIDRFDHAVRAPSNDAKSPRASDGLPMVACNRSITCGRRSPVIHLRPHGVDHVPNMTGMRRERFR